MDKKTIRYVVGGLALGACERHAAAGGPWKTSEYRRESDAALEAAARALLIGDLVAWEFSVEGGEYIEVTKDRRPEVFAEVRAWLGVGRFRTETVPAPPYRGMGALDWDRRDRVPAPPQCRRVPCNNGWMDLLIDGSWSPGGRAAPDAAGKSRRGDAGGSDGGAVAAQGRPTFHKIIAALMVECHFDALSPAGRLKAIIKAMEDAGIDPPTDRTIRDALNGVDDVLSGQGRSRPS